MFRMGQLPELLEYKVTRWRRDPFAGGSYSYIPVGASLRNVRGLAEREGRLHFAGEAVSATEMQMTHGAMATGVSAAIEVVTSLAQTLQTLATQ